MLVGLLCRVATGVAHTGAPPAVFACMVGCDAWGVPEGCDTM